MRIAAFCCLLTATSLPFALQAAASNAGPLNEAKVSFTDVAEKMGINTQGPTAGSAWGDANDDGWPDLWVSNHHGRAPHLFISQTAEPNSVNTNLTNINSANATLSGFTDNASQLDIATTYEDGVWPDFHGAAWADFDNDGDQDLVVLTGAGAGRGSSANYLFENRGDQYVNLAPAAGIDYPQGRGRTPLWLDANADGVLDLLVMNKKRNGAPSRLYLKQPAANVFDIDPSFEAKPGWWESFSATAAQWLGFGNETLSSAAEFAQLVPSGDQVNLVVWGKQTQLRSLANGSLQRLSLPEHSGVRGIQDAALADFTGDGITDWFVLRSLPFMRDVKELGKQELHAVLNGDNEKPAGLLIATDGELQLSAFRPWMDPSDPKSTEPLRLVIGNEPRTTSNVTTSVTRDEATTSANALSGSTLSDALAAAISVNWLTETGEWQITNRSGPLNIEIKTAEPITAWRAEGFRPANGAATSSLLVSGNVTDSETGLPESFSEVELPKWPCQSVTAADFDNDTDVDLFLVCTNPVDNAEDLFLENDGKGNFTPHKQPSNGQGRGNQVSSADFNRDGFVDLAITNGNGAPPFAEGGALQLLQNDGNDNAWIEIDLHGTQSNSNGVGAIVTLSAGGKQQIRLQHGGTHSFSQDHQRLHFGLGDSETIDTLRIRWPSGAVQVLENVSARQFLSINESSAP